MCEDCPEGQSSFCGCGSESTLNRYSALMLPGISMRRTEFFSYLRTNGSLSRKYRVWRDETFLYCEMRTELVGTETGIEDKLSSL